MRILDVHVRMLCVQSYLVVHPAPSSINRAAKAVDRTIELDGARKVPAGSGSPDLGASSSKDEKENTAWQKTGEPGRCANKKGSMTWYVHGEKDSHGASCVAR